MRSIAFVALLAPSLALAAPTKESQLLARAIDAMNNFDDDSAERGFREVLRAQPTAHEAATSHLYLGLIDLNRSKVDAVRQEFEAAIESDPLIELPHSASPKARGIFTEAADRVAQRNNDAATAAPAAVHVVTERVTLPPPKPPSRVPTFVVGGLAVAAAGAGAAFGVLAQNAFNQAKGDLAAGPASSDLSRSGTDGLVADICYGGAAALAVTSAILFLTSMPPSTDAPSKRVAFFASPLPQGGLAELRAQF